MANEVVGVVLILLTIFVFPIFLGPMGFVLGILLLLAYAAVG